MSEEQVRELAERLRRADEEQHEESLDAMPAEPYLALAREALAYAAERAEPPARPALSDEELALELRQAAYDAGGGHPDYYKPRDLGEAPIRKFWLAAARRARELLPAARATSREPTSTKALALQFLARRAEKAPVAPPEPAAVPEATQVAGEPADAATAATEGWRGKRAIHEGSSPAFLWTDENYLICSCGSMGTGDPIQVAEEVARRWNGWAELQAEKEQLSCTVEWLAERLAWQKQLTRMARAERGFQEERLKVLRGSNRELAADLAQTAIERDELWRRCKWAAGELRTIVNDHAEGVAAVLSGVQPVPGGEEGQDG